MTKLKEIGLRGISSRSKLTKKQVQEVKAEMAPRGVPVRFMDAGRSVNISTGERDKKRMNVIHQRVYWDFPKETSKKIAKWLGVRAVFSKQESPTGRQVTIKDQ